MTCANYLGYACSCGGEWLEMAKVQFYKIGHKRQEPFVLTTRTPIVNSEAISRMSEKERTAFEPCILNP